LCTPNDGLVAAGLAHLICADPFALHRPGTKALMVWVIASEVAMFDQSATRVAAVKVDDFELVAHVSKATM
jgi:hypothetical protein